MSHIKKQKNGINDNDTKLVDLNKVP